MFKFGWASLFRPRLASCAASAVLLSAFAVSPPAEAVVRRSILRTPQVGEAPSPLLILVSIRKQRLRVFDVSGERANSRVSTGQPGFDTPTGVFSILEKKEHHESNIYEGAEMPFMQRVTWSGIALHAGNVPGYRASHGCVRLPASFAQSLFSLTNTGARVVITADEAQPMPFRHDKLFKPLPLKAAANTTGPAQPRLAANDKSPDAGAAATDGPAENPLMIGISPALAAAVADLPPPVPPRPTSRTEIDMQLTEKVSKLQAALRRAEEARIAATDKAKAAVKDAEEATAKLEAEKRLIEPKQTAIKTAEKKLQDAAAAFAAFMSGRAPPPAAADKPESKGPDPKGEAKAAPATAEEREADMEDALLDQTIELDGTRNAAAQGELVLAEAQASFARADAQRNAALEEVRQAQVDLRSAQAGLIETNKEITRRAKPVSVFVSLKAARIYVRQGFEPLLEAPIDVADPNAKYGTHVFTAMRFGTDPNDFDWQVVNAQMPASIPARGKRDAAQPAPLAAAAAALEAFNIPEDIRKTIAELARPGASLIVSDRELPANENGMGTEFVVLTR